uniref:Uncharacterized protein n=1 Tax=Acrobeloides nanus TaxID=290746 RepID=A0A914D1V7_9BILA
MLLCHMDDEFGSSLLLVNSPTRDRRWARRTDGQAGSMPNSSLYNPFHEKIGKKLA